MKAKITHMWLDCLAPDDDFPSYIVESREDCEDDSDKSAYDALVDCQPEQCVQMGKICVERI